MQKSETWNLMVCTELSSVVLSKRRTAYKRALKEAEYGSDEACNGISKSNERETIQLLKNGNKFLLKNAKKLDRYYNLSLRKQAINWNNSDSKKAISPEDESEKEDDEDDDPLLIGISDPSTTPDLTAFLAEQRSALEALQSAVKALQTGDHGAKKSMDETSPSVERSLNTLSKTVETLATKVDAQASTAASLSKTMETLATKVDAQANTATLDSLRSAVEALSTRAAGGQSEEALKGLEAKITSTIAPLEEKVTRMEVLLLEIPKGDAVTEQMQSIVSKINDTYVPVSDSVKDMTEKLSSISSSLSDLTHSESKHLVDITHAVGAGVKLAMEEVASDEKARAESQPLAAGFDVGQIQDQIKLIDTKIAEQNTEIGKLIETTTATNGSIDTFKSAHNFAIASLPTKEDLEEVRERVTKHVENVFNELKDDMKSTEKLSTEHRRRVWDEIENVHKKFETQNTMIEALDSTVKQGIAAAEERITGVVESRIEKINNDLVVKTGSQDRLIQINKDIATKEATTACEELIQAQDAKIEKGDQGLQAQIDELKETQTHPAEGAAGEQAKTLKPAAPIRKVDRPPVGKWVESAAGTAKIPDLSEENAVIKDRLDHAGPRVDTRRSRPAGSTAPAAQVTRQGVAPAGQRPVGASMEDSLDDPVEDSQGFQRPTTMLAYLSRQFGP